MFSFRRCGGYGVTLGMMRTFRTGRGGGTVDMVRMVAKHLIVHTQDLRLIEGGVEARSLNGETIRTSVFAVLGRYWD